MFESSKLAMTNEEISSQEKKKQLFLRQRETLNMFLERGAISQAQYDKSLGDLIKLMGMQDAD